jgi:hypothetical protein
MQVGKILIYLGLAESSRTDVSRFAHAATIA